MSKVQNLYRQWMEDPTYRKTHAALAPEFELERAVMAARVAHREPQVPHATTIG